MLGPEAGGDVVVLAFDVEHDDRVRPVQQVRDHDAHALAAARGGGQHHRELARQREELAAVAADQDARCRRLALAAQQVGSGDFRGVGEAGIPVQRATRTCRGEQHAGQHDHQSEAGRDHRGDELFAKGCVVGVEVPVVDDARPACLPRIGLVQHQEQCP